MDIRIQVMCAGEVCVAPALPFGGEDAGIIAASGLLVRQDDRLWLPVFAYLIDHPRGFVLVDTGWDRSMSPEGRFDKRAQVESLGSRRLYRVNQGVVEEGQTVVEQLAARGLAPEDLECVLLTHLDCDHANGLRSLSGARRKLVSADELASVRKNLKARIRYQAKWWEGTDLEAFDWNGAEGPHGRSFDLFGDGSVVCIGIPGHSDGLFAVKVTGDDGRFALLCSDGAYGARSWQDMVLPGIAEDRAMQRASLQWIRDCSLDPLCVEVLASHDREVEPHTVELVGVREIAAPGPTATELDDQADGGLSDAIRQNAGKVAIAAMLASTLSAAPITHEAFPLPDATPIVHVLDQGADDTPPATPHDDRQNAGKAAVWKKVLDILKYVLLVLLLVGGIVLAGINGCTSCASGSLAAPTTADDSSE